MATNYAASLDIALRSLLTPDATVDGRAGSLSGDLSQTDRWTSGNGSGQISAPYRRLRTIGSGATDSYNLLAAGALRDLDGQVIDADELKAMVLVCTSGKISMIASAGTPIGFFGASGDKLYLSAGHALAVSFGAAGLDVTVNSLFEIKEETGTGSSVYSLAFVAAQ